VPIVACLRGQRFRRCGHNVAGHEVRGPAPQISQIALVCESRQPREKNPSACRSRPGQGNTDLISTYLRHLACVGRRWQHLVVALEILADCLRTDQDQLCERVRTDQLLGTWLAPCAVRLAARRFESCAESRSTSLTYWLILMTGYRLARDAREPMESWPTPGPRVQRESPAPRRGRPHPSPKRERGLSRTRHFVRGLAGCRFHARRSRGATSMGRAPGWEVRAIVCACGIRVCVRV
jgi:hypothetical protein